MRKVLISAIETASKSPEVVEEIRKIGAIVDYIPGDRYNKMMAEEHEMVRHLMKTNPPAAQ